MKTSWITSFSLAALTVVKADSNANPQPAAKRPNIIFILTDDQDARMNSVEYMQGVQHHLVSLRRLLAPSWARKLTGTD